MNRTIREHSASAVNTFRTTALHCTYNCIIVMAYKTILETPSVKNELHKDFQKLNIKTQVVGECPVVLKFDIPM